MPGKNDHVKNARHNHEFWCAQALSTTRFRDWVVTGIFYEAVHWVEAFLATKGDHPTSHGLRNASMSRYSELDPVLLDYDVLKAESENARYNCYAHTVQDVQRDMIPLVAKIETHVSTLI